MSKFLSEANLHRLIDYMGRYNTKRGGQDYYTTDEKVRQAAVSWFMYERKDINGMDLRQLNDDFIEWYIGAIYENPNHSVEYADRDVGRCVMPQVVNPLYSQDGNYGVISGQTTNDQLDRLYLGDLKVTDNMSAYERNMFGSALFRAKNKNPHLKKKYKDRLPGRKTLRPGTDIDDAYLNCKTNPSDTRNNIRGGISDLYNDENAFMTCSNSNPCYQAGCNYCDDGLRDLIETPLRTRFELTEDNTTDLRVPFQYKPTDSAKRNLAQLYAYDKDQNERAEFRRINTLGNSLSTDPAEPFIYEGLYDLNTEGAAGIIPLQYIKDIPRFKYGQACNPRYKPEVIPELVMQAAREDGYVGSDKKYYPGDKDRKELRFKRQFDEWKEFDKYSRSEPISQSERIRCLLGRGI